MIQDCRRVFYRNGGANAARAARVRSDRVAPQAGGERALELKLRVDQPRILSGDRLGQPPWAVQGFRSTGCRVRGNAWSLPPRPSRSSPSLWSSSLLCSRWSTSSLAEVADADSACPSLSPSADIGKELASGHARGRVRKSHLARYTESPLASAWAGERRGSVRGVRGFNPAAGPVSC